jgi:RNA polymerase sigma-70 factor (ECF subfamily)
VADVDPTAVAPTVAHAASLEIAHEPAALVRAIAAQLARTMPAGTVDLEGYVTSLHARDLALASLAAAGHDAAAERIYTEHEPTAQRAMRAARVPLAIAEDALARLWERVLVGGVDGGPPSIGTYSGRGPLGAWLHVAVVREAHHESRAASRRAGDADVDADAEAEARLGSLAGSELEYMKGRYAAAFSAALREALACLEPRLRSVLRSTYVDGVSADKLAKLYGVHRVTVARWLGDARLAVAEDTRRRMAVALAVPAEESESILRLVRSRLDLSLGALDAGAFDANA